MFHTSITLNLPDWLPLWLDKYLLDNAPLNTAEQRMILAIELSHQNVLHSTGGPFGAAIFNMQDGSLLGVGVNQVVAQSCAIAHAEVMAFMMAQQRLKTFDLAQDGLPPYELVTSAQMCAMCLGATVWSGVKQVIIGATTDDVESIVGFDEGPMAENWQKQLEDRNIQVVTDVCRSQACEVLKLYNNKQGLVYSPVRPPA